ncbi:hypothetical protein Drose_09040 [Dactylosporangium roseum]|uniref:Uncharacterized protein n=1 Tax=Dactylosporangium roseum TaxID=47989 RepID=A0ABY5ZBK1_9ACTN|nr:hypothetical protein [Dactylosporangium roseum]UWZ38370.1 hypothetical protein Drose_09040 [Dactylosporangium roseum]
MTATVEVPTPEAIAAAPAGRRLLAWAPPAAVAVMIAAGLTYYGVPLLTVAIFAAYLALGVILPGTLIWRGVRGRSGWFVEDVAAGLAVGYSCEVLVYIVCRWFGLPLLTVAWAVATVAAFAAVPRLRRHWRGSDRPEERTPFWWSLILSASAVILFYWSCVRFFRTHDLSEPGSRAPDADSPFHLALLGEAKHHMPLMSPWLPDQPVLYHWFVYAEMSATSWITGIEPHTLLIRLSPLPMIIGFLVLVGVLGRRLTGEYWAGAAAAVITFFALTPAPYQWRLNGWFSTFATNAYEDGSSLRAQLWTSPTQTFGAVLFAALALALVEALAESTRLRWALVVLLTAAVTGAKATFLPMLLAGLLLVVVTRILTRRRVHRGALLAAGLAFVALLFAQFVLFGGAAQGMAIDPLHFAQISGAPYSTGFARPDPSPALWRLVLVTLITLLCWAFIWPGLLGLARLVKGRRPDPQIAADPVILVLGIGLSGVGALMIFGHEGGAEGWFMVSGRPYLSLAAAVGLALVTPPGLPRRRTLIAACGAVATGALIMIGVRELGSQRAPGIAVTGGYVGTAWQLVWPYLLITVLVGVAVFVIHRSRRLPAKQTLVAAVLTGVCLVGTVVHLYLTSREASTTGFHGVRPADPYITAGSEKAGRWLRDHSDPDDVVATNAHCLIGKDRPEGCDNRHFSLSAYTERRFLVESWGFTNRTHERAAETKRNAVYVPFWDERKLADNDAAFHDPSAVTIGRLRDVYRVRWLMVDETYETPNPGLADVAKFRFRAGRIAVYEIER